MTMTPLPVTHTSPTVLGYVWAIVGMCVATMVAILGITAIRPDGDNTTTYTLIIGITGPAVATMVALMVKSTHDLTNSRMDEFKDALLAIAERDNQKAFADGKIVGAVGVPVIPLKLPVVTEPIPIQIVSGTIEPKP